MSEEKVIDFASAGDKHRHNRANDEKDAKAEALRQRFAQALPDKPTPVKDYLKRKRAKKKR